MSIDKNVPTNNLLQIREANNYSQVDMGQLLGVSQRMISNYETNTNAFPIEKALILFKKWGLSLDYIYCLSHTSVEAELNGFSTDLRKIININNNEVCFNIPECYYRYLASIDIIKNSNNPKLEMARAITELNVKYTPDTDDIHIYQHVIPWNDFSSYLNVSNNLIPYLPDEEGINFPPTTDTQIKEFNAFLESLN